MAGIGWLAGWLGWLDGWRDGWLEGWTAGWMDGWLDGWRDAGMDSRVACVSLLPGPKDDVNAIQPASVDASVDAQPRCRT